MKRDLMTGFCLNKRKKENNLKIKVNTGLLLINDRRLNK